MSDYEIKATVLGFHPEHGELIAASEAKEAITHFNDIAKAELAKAKEDYKTLFSAFESCQDELKESNERVKELEKERDHSQRMYNSLLGDLSAGYGDLSISECEKHLNKFAVEKKIEALESCIDDNAMDNDEIDALIIYVDDVKADIEQLRKEQE